MKVMQKSKFHILKSAILAIILLFGVTTITVVAGTSTINIDPLSKTVSSGETFTVNVSCTPAQPIKAFEFKLSFDPSLLQINSVTEGDIFNGYSTFNSSAMIEIDNTAGTVVNIYGLIMGSGNVTGSGTFVIISCTAKDTTGVSSLDLYEVGVTDEAGYLNITVNDGSVTIQGTDDEDPPGDGGSPGGGGGYIPPGEDDDDQNDTGEQNNSPETPIKPSGPTFVEMGVEYVYSSSTYDIDGDQIRYKFDWGDGTYSDWSEFTISNISISMSHSWNLISTFEVKVMAQDENNTNSSWSPSLEIVVSQAASGEAPPIADINFSVNESNNLTIEFDASGSFDPDGNIANYLWDFGDGENGTGISPIHKYAAPGTYTVTLEITDNNSNIIYSKSIIVIVGSEAEQESEEQGFPLIYIVIGVIGFAVAIFICLMVFFREKVTYYFSQHHNQLSLKNRDSYEKNKIEKLDVKIQELKKTRENIGYKKNPDVKMDKQPGEIMVEGQKTFENNEHKIESTPEKVESFNDVSTQKKIDNDISSIERKVDKIILSKTNKKD